MQFRFSLLTLFLMTVAAAVTFALCCQVPSGQFAFEGRSPKHRPLTARNVATRMLIVSPLVAIECVGIFLLVRQYRSLRKK